LGPVREIQYSALSPRIAPSAPAAITSASSSLPSEAATDAVVNVVSPGKIGTIASANTRPKTVK